MPLVGPCAGQPSNAAIVPKSEAPDRERSVQTIRERGRGGTVVENSKDVPLRSRANLNGPGSRGPRGGRRKRVEAMDIDGEGK